MYFLVLLIESCQQLWISLISGDLSRSLERLWDPARSCYLIVYEKNSDRGAEKRTYLQMGFDFDVCYLITAPLLIKLQFFSLKMFISRSLGSQNILILLQWWVAMRICIITYFPKCPKISKLEIFCSRRIKELAYE